MKQIIYADNAATTKLNIKAYENMLPWLIDEYGNASQPYAFSRKPKKALIEARNIIAQCINALPEEIFFTSGGTESDNWAIKGIAFKDQSKKEIITSEIEHHAVLNSCLAIERMGCAIKFLHPDKYGIVHPAMLDSVISDNTKMVSLMLSNNEIGTIEPIKELTQITHYHNAIMHTDAVQAVGHIKIDVNELGIDLLSASAHKFNGPKGIGFLYIRKGTDIITNNDGGAQECGMRAGTENIAAIVGMATALSENIRKLEENEQHIINLENRLISILESSDIDFIRNGSKNHMAGNVSLSFKDCDGEAILHRLDLIGICISTGSACDSVNSQISHVIRAIELDEMYARGTIRISLGINNTSEEVEQIAKSIIKIIKNR